MIILRILVLPTFLGEGYESLSEKGKMLALIRHMAVRERSSAVFALLKENGKVR